jgi:hypothetical protein
LPVLRSGRYRVPSACDRGAKKDRSAAPTAARAKCRTAAATGPAGSWAATRVGGVEHGAERGDDVEGAVIERHVLDDSSHAAILTVPCRVWQMQMWSAEDDKRHRGDLQPHIGANTQGVQHATIVFARSQA